LGEFGIAILLALLAKKMPRGALTNAVRTGVAGGVEILVYYAVAYGITDGLILR
jgi:hypothetical protein